MENEFGGHLTSQIEEPAGQSVDTALMPNEQQKCMEDRIPQGIPAGPFRGQSWPECDPFPKPSRRDTN
ncbi:hypothetical protein ACFVVU_18740 [Kitasatospora sp. NPDC057965]|uniref:hypothetical protein n=1 Tax=Kitasatospora sp. NPDC057965 TaxID=3346291 RepID=UPI0036DE72CC